jgi:hypothetical protein
MVKGVRRLARYWILVLALLTAFGEASAWAAAPATMVIVVDGDDKLATAIPAELPAPWAPADPDAVTAAAQKRRFPASTGALRDKKARGPYVQKLLQVAVDSGAKAALVVYVPKGKKRVAHVTLLSSAGPTLVDTQVSLASPDQDAAVVTRAFSRELVALGASPEPAPQPAPATAPAPAVGETLPDAPKPATPPAPDAPPAAPKAEAAGAIAPWIVATATMELANRHLTYSDVVTSNIHSDNSGIVPMPAIALDLFPFAPGGTRFLQDLGVFGDFKLGLVSQKTLADGTKAPASWTRFDAGLKYRIWIKRTPKSPIISLALSYGQESYRFHPSTAPAEPLDTPSASYAILRPRIEARVPVGPVVLLVGGGYLAVLDTVAFAGNFRDPSIYAWEADFALAVPIGNVIEVRGGIAYRRFVHIFGAAKGDPYIASVADDQMFRGDLGISAHF